MADIYVVNHAVSGFHAQVSTYYHKTEIEAQESFHDCVKSASDDPNMVSLILLDTETLDATTLIDWEVTADDIEDDDEGYDSAEDEEIMVGQP